MIHTFLFFLLLFSSTLTAAVIEIDGKDINCIKKSSELFHCVNGTETILVKKGFSSFMAFSKDSKAGLKIPKVTKVVDGLKILYVAKTDTNLSFGSFETGMLSYYDQQNINETFLANFKDVDDPVARELFLAAENQHVINRKAQLQKISIMVKNKGETLQCVRGKSVPNKTLINFETENRCEYLSCSTMDSEEKILAFIPDPLKSYRAPFILRMKNGQADLVDHDLKVMDEKKLTILQLPAVKSSAKSTESSFLDGDSLLFVPSKYQRSQSSFLALTSLHDNEVDDDAKKCSDKEITDLINLKDKTAKEMRDHIATAEVVEYLKIHDGNIHSYYVDRLKGQSLGCEYNNKILDKSVLGHLDYLKKISNSTQDQKYLSITEAQALFKKAQDMKDIPFGYKYDGCYARAHLMARRFEAEGIPTQKVWIKGDLYVPGTDISWNYHVAPVIDVKEHDGTIKKYVIDPSLNDKAVTIDEWVASMKSHGKGPIMKTTYPFPSNSADFQRTTVALSSSDPYAPLDIKNLDEETKIAYAEQTLKEFSAALRGAK